MSLRTQRLLVACVLAACGAACCFGGAARMEVYDDQGNLTGERISDAAMAFMMLLGAVTWAPFAVFFRKR